MKTIELLTDKRAIDAIHELLEGANKLKVAKKYFESLERKPEFLEFYLQSSFFELIDLIDVKIFEAIEETNKSISFIVRCGLDGKIND